MKNQPILDQIVIWKGFGYPHKPNNPWDSKCRLRVWQQNPVIVLFSDLDIPDTGTSITNCCENLATIVQFYYLLKPPIRWFEHYPRHNRSPEGQQESPETVDEIFYDYDANQEQYKKPRWKAFDRDSFEQLVNCSISMNVYGNLPEVTIKTPWEHNQDEFARGKADALFRNPRIYPPHSEAYTKGYRYGIVQQSELN